MTTCRFRWRESSPDGMGKVWRACVREPDHDGAHEYVTMLIDGTHRRIAQELELTGPELVAEHTGHEPKGK